MKVVELFRFVHAGQPAGPARGVRADGRRQRLADRRADHRGPVPRGPLSGRRRGGRSEVGRVDADRSRGRRCRGAAIRPIARRRRRGGRRAASAAVHSPPQFEDRDAARGLLVGGRRDATRDAATCWSPMSTARSSASVRSLSSRTSSTPADGAARLESVHVRERPCEVAASGAVTARARPRTSRATRGCYRVQLTSRNVRVDAHRFYRRQRLRADEPGLQEATSRLRPLAGRRRRR